MISPIWITENNLGTFVANNSVSTYVTAKPMYPATQITYSLLSGALPNGLLFTSNGFITGTITTTYASTCTFTVNAIDNLGNSSARTFTMKVSLKPNQPTWITQEGSLGVFPSLVSVSVQLEATANLPAISVSYSLLSGSLPNGLMLSNEGVIYGTPNIVDYEATDKFTIRATDNYQNIRDRTFTMTITGSVAPEFTLPDGNILNTLDSIWVELPITYNNPDENNIIKIYLINGLLPPGLEINDYGLIRGYPNPPTSLVTLSSISTIVTNTQSTTNYITCLSTLGFTPGRAMTFSGSPVFGGLQENTVYYIKSIISPTEFTISNVVNGSIIELTNGSGVLTCNVLPTTVGQPSIVSYNFTLKIDSLLGSDIANYSITVTNQNTPNSRNGPGYPPNTRTPVILNTRPRTYNLQQTDPYYGYYILPNYSNGTTYPVTSITPIGTVQSDNYFTFKIIGLDFDNNQIAYQFINLPIWLTGDADTGWLIGNTNLLTKSITEVSFSVAVYKVNNPNIVSNYFSFSFVLSKDLTNIVTWVTPSDLGTIYNNTISTKNIIAIADEALTYEIIDGYLPPNLTLLGNGEITGYVAFQPTDQILYQNDTTEFTFTVKAYSEEYPVISSTKTFKITVLQLFVQPVDTLYFKATPSIADRVYLNSLLNNEEIIPAEYLYRPDDIYFGKASNVIYEHAFGIYSSNLQEYLEAITKNHYWRNITLGEIETAIARDNQGNIIYEVVYSKIIDNLINPQGQSINMQIEWPRTINLNLGPWYTSVTNIYTSYEDVLQQNFYTSLTPGSANTLYPNSLPNMRQRVTEELGQDLNSKILPLWMTSQQNNSSTLGYTQAWVICYTKPGYSEIIKNNIDTLWLDELGNINKLNKINFKIDRFSVDKSTTYNFVGATKPFSWTSLPSADPVPNPIDSKDFYVLFPRQTILPDDTQY